MGSALYERAAARLAAFGYELTEADAALLSLSAEKAEWTVKNDCNVPEVPDGLLPAAADLAVGEFLRAKKTFAAGDLTAAGMAMDSDAAVKQLQIGDTSTTFATVAESGSQTPEQRLDALIAALLASGRRNFACYRRIRW